MSDSITALTTANVLPRFADGTLRWVRRALIRRLADLDGRLRIRDAEGVTEVGHDRGQGTITVQVNDLAFYAYVALGGAVGVGQAYILRLWDCDDVVGLTRLFVRNRAHLHGLDGGLGVLRMPAYRWMERRRRNSLSGSRRNISAHYDLGNELFALFLDRSMAYSSGIYPTPEASLAEAQLHKYEQICRKLQLQPGDRVVEIGTGWGGFAIHAARHYGVTVTTTTISRQQHDWARRRIDEEGLGGQIRLLDRDYRELDGEYDKLVSIEMIEAVGYDYLPAYLQQCDRLLKPGGQALIQAITIRDQYFETMRRGTDYIREFIFPGGLLPCPSVLLRIATEHSSLALFAMDSYAPDYARTLAHWRERFLAQLPAVRRLGYDEAFVRMWDYYLAYCEGGFLEQAINVSHLLFTKPGCTRSAVAPALDRP